MGKSRHQRRAEARALAEARKNASAAVTVATVPAIAIPSSPTATALTKAPWCERWRLGIRAAETAIVLALWVGGITAADMIFVGILLFLSLIIGIVAIASDPIRSARMRILLSVGLAIFIGASGCLAYYRHEDPIPTALLASQIDDMRNIEQFLTKSQEDIPTYGDPSKREHKKSFDLNTLLSYNIKFIMRNANPSSVSKEESEGIDKYFSNSIDLIDTRYVTFTADPVSHALQINFIPGKIGYIKLPSRYLDSVNKLKQFELLPEMPKELSSKIEELEKILSDNMNLLVETINIQAGKDPLNVLKDQDSHSPYLAATTNLYWSRFIPLKPKVDDIIKTIRSYLKIER